MRKVMLRKWFPLFWFGAVAATIRNTVFINKSVWFYYSQDAQDACLKHEEVHAKQQLKEPFRFWVKYLFNRKHRLEYELPAYVVQINHLVKIKQGKKLDLARKAAEALSSMVYFKAGEYKDILPELIKRLK